MKRTELGLGSKSLERGSTFAARPRAQQRRPISPASPAQRAKISGLVSIVSGDGPCVPAHLWARGRGGCDDPLCVVPLTPLEHRRFDTGAFDLLPYLVPGLAEEIQHALGHANGDLIALLHRLTGERWMPAASAS